MNTLLLPSDPIHLLETDFERLFEELKAFQENLIRLKESGAKTLRDYYEQRSIQWQKTIESAKESLRQRFPAETKKSEWAQNILQRIDFHLPSWEEGYFQERLNECLSRLNLVRQTVATLKFRPFATKSKLQWGRKIFHTFNGLAGLWLWAYSGLAETTVLFILGTYLTYAILTEIFRRVFPAYNRFILKTIGGMMREHETRGISSATYYLVSMLLVFLFFSKDVSILTLFYVAVGDTMAGVVGTLWGRHKLGRHASLEGVAACFFSCFIPTLVFASGLLPSFRLEGAELILFSGLAGVVACIAESSFKKLDDNLVMPLISAPALTVLMALFR